MSDHPEAVGYNWLVHRILHQALALTLEKYARGILADIGCGAKPYASLVAGRVERHIGVDYAGSGHDRSKVDVIADAYDTTLAAASVDTILSTFVLEHLERPLDALREAARILKPGGHLVLTAPLFWHLHEEPRDFFRFTSHGLRSLCSAAGLEVIELQPLSGFTVTFAQEACYRLSEAESTLVRLLARPAAALLQHAAWMMHRAGVDRDTRFSWAWMLVARKPMMS